MKQSTPSTQSHCEVSVKFSMSPGWALILAPVLQLLKTRFLRGPHPGIGELVHLCVCYNLVTPRSHDRKCTWTPCFRWVHGNESLHREKSPNVSHMMKKNVYIWNTREKWLHLQKESPFQSEVRITTLFCLQHLICLYMLVQ